MSVSPATCERITAGLIHLTPAGAAALAAVRAVRTSGAGTALARWDEQDAGRLGALLERLVADLGTAPLPAAG